MSIWWTLKLVLPNKNKGLEMTENDIEVWNSKNVIIHVKKDFK